MAAALHPLRSGPCSSSLQACQTLGQRNKPPPLPPPSCSFTGRALERALVVEKFCKGQQRVSAVRCSGGGPKSKTPPTADASPLVKLAWYASEAAGKVVAIVQGKSTEYSEEEDGQKLSREEVIAALRADYDRSYFVTGDMTMGIYDPECEFADPFVSFKGRKRFKTNVSNLGSFMEDVNLKIVDWKESEDRVATKWRFSCTLGLPWKPILAASGGTEHFLDPTTNKIIKHVESWNISPADGVKQIFKSNPRLRKKAR